MRAEALDLKALAADLGDAATLHRMAAEIAVFNARLCASAGRCSRAELHGLQSDLKMLTMLIARIQRIVSERIGALTAGGTNGS